MCMQPGSSDLQARRHPAAMGSLQGILAHRHTVGLIALQRAQPTHNMFCYSLQCYYPYSS